MSWVELAVFKIYMKSISLVLFIFKNDCNVILCFVKNHF